VIGDGPERHRLEATAGANVRFLGVVDDATLRWCYSRASVLVSVGFEDFGLAPLEAAALGTATVARRFGGALDTVLDGVTGTLLDEVSPARVRDAIRHLDAAPPSSATLADHVSSFSRERFDDRVRALVSVH
jgi:glycosyltransferase involved in cell wall biosynthesis